MPHSRCMHGQGNSSGTRARSRAPLLVVGPLPWLAGLQSPKELPGQAGRAPTDRVTSHTCKDLRPHAVFPKLFFMQDFLA